MRSQDSSERFSRASAALQSSVPGIYAWAVTVAPAACGGGAPLAARLVGLGAPTVLVLGAALEPRFGLRARVLSLWAFVIACGFVWGAAPAELSPLRLDPVRGIAGMFGWALFALACAGGPIGRPAASKRSLSRANGESLPRRVHVETVCVVAGALAAAALQSFGWQAPGAESALLVRFATIAAGLAVLEIAANVAGRQVSGGAAVESGPRRIAWLAVAALAALGSLAFVRLLLR
ncbi:MAG TPA: hypothetical protein VEK07_20020 [Polyangiaceae bacterium]|nr:hypothetical protein [Polyangiaceae bacterium]